MTTSLKTLWHAEDDPDIQFLMQMAVDSFSDIIYRCFDNGQALMQAMATAETQPDLILLDMMMPVMDGLETLKTLRTGTYPFIPVVFLTAKIQPEEVEKYVLAGAEKVLFKPFDPTVITRELERIYASQQNT